MTVDQVCDSQGPNADVADLYPDGTLPEVRLDRISAICSFGHTPRLMTGIIRQILLQVFVDADNIRNSYLREHLRREGVWSGGVDTGILIESLLKWDPTTTGKRPAILIKENDWEWWRVGIGDYAGVDWRSGKEQFLGYWKGSHTIFAIGGEGPETQLLSVEVAKLLLYYGRVITQQMSLHRFVPVKIGSASALQESTENYVVPIVFAYAAEERWSTQVDAPRLKRITLNTDDLMIG